MIYVQDITRGLNWTAREELELLSYWLGPKSSSQAMWSMLLAHFGGSLSSEAGEDLSHLRYKCPVWRRLVETWMTLPRGPGHNMHGVIGNMLLLPRMLNRCFTALGSEMITAITPGSCGSRRMTSASHFIVIKRQIRTENISYYHRIVFNTYYHVWWI